MRVQYLCQLIFYFWRTLAPPPFPQITWRGLQAGERRDAGCLYETVGVALGPCLHLSQAHCRRTPKHTQCCEDSISAQFCDGEGLRGEMKMCFVHDPCPWYGRHLVFDTENKETPWVRPVLSGTGLIFYALLRVYLYVYASGEREHRFGIIHDLYSLNYIITCIWWRHLSNSHNSSINSVLGICYTLSRIPNVN